MSTAIGSPPRPAVGLTFAVSSLEGGRLLGAVTPAAFAARAVVVVLDASGSLAGPPLASARGFVERLAAATVDRPLAVIASGGQTPSLLRALGPVGAEQRPLPRVAPAGRADLSRAAALVRAEALRAAGGPAGVDVVLVSDLALPPGDVAALQALEREGARLHVVHAPSPRPSRADLEPAARLGDGDAVSSLLARLGGHVEGRLVVDLVRVPRAWFAWRAGRLEGGARASLARVERPLGDAALAFVVDAVDGEASLGAAWVQSSGGDDGRRLALDLPSEGVDPALVDAVRLLARGGP